MSFRGIAYGAIKLGATLALAGLLAATMIRLAPGFEVDENELDARLSAETVHALRSLRAKESNIFLFYRDYLIATLRGDLGTSRSLDRPVTELLAERFPVTLRSVGAGLAMGWAVALALAMGGSILRNNAYDLASSGLSGLFLCLPSALLAFFFLLLGAPVALGIAAVIFPRVFHYARSLFRNGASMPHIWTAEAKGLGPIRIFTWHILPQAIPELLALCAVSLTIALGAAVPIEVICDSPGIGQLAWKAAIGRDLTLLVSLTLVMTAITVAATLVSDLAIHGARARRS